MTEAELFEEIRKLLHLYNWRWYHTRDSRGSNAGFPDLVMLKPSADGTSPSPLGRILYRELKSEKGRLSLAQASWIDALKAAGQDVAVWRPSDMEKIGQTLSFPGGRTISSYPSRPSNSGRITCLGDTIRVIWCPPTGVCQSCGAQVAELSAYKGLMVCGACYATP